jgi:hypothetical protein
MQDLEAGFFSTGRFTKPMAAIDASALSPAVCTRRAATLRPRKRICWNFQWDAAPYKGFQGWYLIFRIFPHLNAELTGYDDVLRGINFSHVT